MNPGVVLVKCCQRHTLQARIGSLNMFPLEKFEKICALRCILLALLGKIRR